MTKVPVIIGQVLSILSTLLQIPVLLWHSKQKNVATVCLIGWVTILNLHTFISSFVWASDDPTTWWNGKGYCDILVRFSTGANTGVLCAVIANARGLAILLSDNGPTIDPNSFRRRVTDLTICLTWPIIDMALYIIYSQKRYILIQYEGCNTFIQVSWPTAVIHFLPPLILSIIGVVYASLALIRYIRKRQDFKDLLHTTNSGLSASRFIRLLVFVSVVVLIMFPLTIVFFVGNMSIGNIWSAYEWQFGDNRNDNNGYLGNYWDVTTKMASGLKSDAWIYIVIGIIQFGCFGTGRELANLYLKFLRFFGFYKLKKNLRQRRRRKDDYDSSISSTILPMVEYTRNSSQTLTKSPSELSEFSVDVKMKHHTTVRQTEHSSCDTDMDLDEIINGASYKK